MTESAPQTQRGTIRLHVFGRTDVGRVREHNEDNFLVADLSRHSRRLLEEDRVQPVGDRGTVLAVCDGMGGAAAGEVASELAVNILFEKLNDGEPPVGHNELAWRLVRAVEAAGMRIYSEAKLDRQHRGMGTTATVAALIDPVLFLAQVGDSRAYVLRNDRLVQVTRDQSLVNQLIEAGQLTEEEAENFEHNNIILQALGTADTVQVDLTFVHLRRGDTLLLCSDGLSGMIRLDEIRESLMANPDPVDACRVLTERANQAGGHDNITCIVARFEGDGLEPPSSSDDYPKYAKYVLPEECATEPTVPSRRAMGKDGDPYGPEGKPRTTDHGASRFKVAQTMLGMHSPMFLATDNVGDSNEFSSRGTAGWPDASLPGDDDDIVLPVSGIPLWLLLSVVVGVLGAIILLAIYLIRS